MNGEFDVMYNNIGVKCCRYFLIIELMMKIFVLKKIDIVEIVILYFIINIIN